MIQRQRSSLPSPVFAEKKSAGAAATRAPSGGFLLAAAPLVDRGDPGDPLDAFVELPDRAKAIGIRNLVHLREDDDERPLAPGDALYPFDVLLRRRVTRVDELHDAGESRTALDIGVDDPQPVLPRIRGEPREAVARKIDEVEPVVDGVEIHRPRLAGFVADAGEVLPLEEGVEERRFSDVRSPRHGDLLPRRFREPRGIERRARDGEALYLQDGRHINWPTCGAGSRRSRRGPADARFPSRASS